MRAPWTRPTSRPSATGRGSQPERAVKAGYDIVYVYAGHDYLPFQFLSPRTNRRTDEYGGSTENRTRLVREMIEVTREATRGKAASRCAWRSMNCTAPHGISARRRGA